MKQIPLTQGKFALVDDADYERVIAMGSWQLHTNGCAAKKVRYYENKKISSVLRMHRFITDAPKDMVVDHKNGNRLDNRKCNLRICTQAENRRNSLKSRNNATGYKGVTFNVKNQKYVSQIGVNYKHLYLGSFICPIEAARAYNAAAIIHYGEFARLNEIPA